VKKPGNKHLNANTPFYDKNNYLHLLIIFYLASQAQVSKNINVATAGTLTTLLSSTEKTTISNLTITGVIDSRDVKCMRDEIINLSVLDISAVSIQSYNGADGTYPGTISYPADEMPLSSFLMQPNTPKLTLTSITLPNSLKSIGSYAFAMCTGISPSITIPASVTAIWNYAFMGCTGINKISVLTSMPPNATSTTFISLNKSNCTLEVPIGSKSTYQKTTNWSDFGFLIEKSFTTQLNNTSLSNNHYEVYTSQSQIFVAGTSMGEIIYIYNTNGNLLNTVESKGSLMTIPMKNVGVYIVKIGGRTEKIVL
jgi:hypothetical protein